MNIGKILKSAVRYAKDNPEKVIAVATIIAPAPVKAGVVQAVTKLAPKVVKAVAVVKAVKG